MPQALSPMKQLPLEVSPYPNRLSVGDTSFLGVIVLSGLFIGLMNFTNVTFVDQVSGILGLGFPRLSKIHTLAANGMSTRWSIAFS
jgi:hypothetical protein